MPYSCAMKPWAWLLIFFLTAGASIYLWKKSPQTIRESVPGGEPGANSPQVPPPIKEPGTTRLPAPRIVQPDGRSNNNPGIEVPPPAPHEPPSEFNAPPIPQPPGFYPPPGSPEGEVGYPGYVPPPEEGENGFVPPPFEPPPPLDEEFIPPPPPPDTDSEL